MGQISSDFKFARVIFGLNVFCRFFEMDVEFPWHTKGDCKKLRVHLKPEHEPSWNLAWSKLDNIPTMITPDPRPLEHRRNDCCSTKPCFLLFLPPRTHRSDPRRVVDSGIRKRFISDVRLCDSSRTKPRLTKENLGRMTWRNSAPKSSISAG